MKKSLFVLIVLILLFSCEKENANHKKSAVNFDNKILDGYFVTSIAFDNLGNAWIGTFEQGLIKYNSKETIVYNSENSIISDESVINDIAIDSKNNVWIGSDGLIKFDGKEFTKYNSKNTPIPEDYVSSISIDSKDNIWFTSCRFKQGGVVKYDNNNWTVYTPINSDLPANLVTDIAIDKNDNVWLALSEIVNNSHLVKISDDNWTVYNNSDLGFTPYFIESIKTNSKNKLCASIDYSFSSAIVHNTPDLFIYDEKTTQQIKNKENLNINFITVDNEDNIWCGTYDGYAVYDGQKWTTTKTTSPKVSIFAIEQSPDNKMWIGTNNGIYINN